MNMYSLWDDKTQATCERYAIGEISHAEAVEKLRGMGLCEDEARNHLDAAADERNDMNSIDAAEWRGVDR